MSDFSLRLPYPVYLSVASILVGVLIAPAVRDVPPNGHNSRHEMPEMSAEAHAHGTIDIPAIGAPQVSMEVERDPTGGWNVTIETANFTFMPDAVNGEHVPNGGHAHLYVDGLKVARLYGPHFHVGDLAPGTREIVVSLATNDHAYYVVDGARIEARATVTSDRPTEPQS